VGPRAGLDGWGKSRPIGIRSPDRPPVESRRKVKKKKELDLGKKK